MKFSKPFKNQLINNDLDLSSFDNKELVEWLISNFINILCDQQIFVSHVTHTPKEDASYKTLFALNAKNDNSSYKMEFGIIRNIKVVGKLQQHKNRLSILMLNYDFYDSDNLNMLKNKNYNLSKIQSRNTLIIWD